LPSLCTFPFFALTPFLCTYPLSAGK
jgi:hypothetical protein